MPLAAPGTGSPLVLSPHITPAVRVSGVFYAVWRTVGVICRRLGQE
jgi:hypothetical protein